MRVLFLSLTLFGISQIATAQLKQWPLDKMDSLQKSEVRPMVVFVYTKWCKYCEAMKNTTLKDENVVSLLNEQFYFFSLDAEDKSDIHVAGREFKFKATGNNTGLHELAEQVAKIDGQISYPTLCFLNPDFSIAYQHPQYISSEELRDVLNKWLSRD